MYRDLEEVLIEVSNYLLIIERMEDLDFKSDDPINMIRRSSMIIGNEYKKLAINLLDRIKSELEAEIITDYDSI